MRSDFNEERFNELIKNAKEKTKTSEHPVLSSKESLLEDGLIYYKQARDMSLHNQTVAKKIKKIETQLKKIKDEEISFTRGPKP